MAMSVMVDVGRARRLSKRIGTVVASAIEFEIKDPPLAFVTITDTKVTGDLHDATVYYTVRGDTLQDEPDYAGAAAALERAKGTLRSKVGAATGVRFTPTLCVRAGQGARDGSAHGGPAGPRPRRRRRSGTNSAGCQAGRGRRPVPCVGGGGVRRGTTCSTLRTPVTTIDPTTELASQTAVLETASMRAVLPSCSTRRRSVSVLCHVYPDADTIGAGLALALVLEREGKSVEVGFATPRTCRSRCSRCPAVTCWSPPTRCAATPIWWSPSTSRASTGSARWRSSPSPAARCWSSTTTRPTTCSAPPTTSTRRRTRRRCWSPSFSTRGASRSTRVAHCLYAGLTTDTGSFRWASARAHQLAARLVELGVDNAAISRRLLDTHPFSWLPMLSRVLGSARSWCPRPPAAAVWCTPLSDTRNGVRPGSRRSRASSTSCAPRAGRGGGGVQGDRAANAGRCRCGPSPSRPGRGRQRVRRRRSPARRRVLRDRPAEDVVKALTDALG